MLFRSLAVQHECIPQAILGMDVLCQAKSGMGKTAVFVLATLQQLEPKAGEISVVVMCHTRELAYQVKLFPPCCSFVTFTARKPLPLTGDLDTFAVQH